MEAAVALTEHKE